MFKSPKFIALFVTELAMPLIIFLESIPTIYFWNLKHDLYYRQGLPSYSAEYIAANDRFHFFFGLTMISGLVVVISMIIIGFAAMIIMLTDLTGKEPKEHRTTRSIIIMAGGIFCNFVVILIMLVVFLFTYAQGV